MALSDWTMEDLQNLRDAIKTGALRVKYNDKEVWYRSLAEMRALERDMCLKLGLISQNNTRILAKFNDGLEDCDDDIE